MSRSRAIALSIFLGAAAAVSTASVAVAADGRGFGGGFGRHRGGAPFLMVLLLAAVVVLAVVAWRSRRPSAAPFVASPPASPTLNAQAILADRLARGEISPDDYRSAVSVLRETSPPS